MCGISGCIDFSEPQVLPDKEVEISLKALAHRGPDDKGIEYFGKGVFAHARLGILDPGPGSHQPFISEDGRYILVYNGEIFNFQELRKELEKEGISFKTTGDTEVLMHCLIKDGKAGLHRLNGFFAFVFYDKVKDEVLIGRDRFGIKPLVYSVKENRICFASEQAALLPYLSKINLDTAGVNTYFNLGYVPAPQSVIQEVNKLRPGFLISYVNGKYAVEQYFKPENWKTNTQTNLADLLEDAVKIRLIADRPLGCFLSSGIDSSIITALAARHHAGLKSYSLSFPEFAYLDESTTAQKVAKHVGAEHVCIPFTLNDLKQSLPSFLNNIDSPFADASALAVWMLSRECSREVKVVLSGDGADELFAGYRKHRAALMFSKPTLKALFKRIPRLGGHREGFWADIKRKSGRLAYLSKLSDQERLLAMASFAEPNHIRELFKNGDGSIQLSADSALTALPDDWMQKVLEFDRQIVLPDDMLYKSDSSSMAHGLELRCPFLDYRLVNYARSLHPADLLNYRKGKLPLRKAFAHLLPGEVFSKPKRGFEIPLATLMKSLPSEWNFRFDKDFVEKQGIFNPQAVTNLANGRHTNAFDQWAYLIFQAWYIKTFNPF